MNTCLAHVRIYHAASVIDPLVEDSTHLYLEACADEDPGNLIRAVLNDIARTENMSQLARGIGMSQPPRILQDCCQRTAARPSPPWYGSRGNWEYGDR